MNCNDICFYKQEEERLSVNEFFLLLACEEGHKEWIQWICHYDINIDLSMRNFLPLQTACQTNNTETMLYLIQRHPDAITSIKEYIYEQIMNYNVSMIITVYQEFPTIFHLFTSNEFIEILYVLCEINMKLAYWFCDKFPFIHVIRDNHRLFINAYLSENLEIIKLLFDKLKDQFSSDSSDPYKVLGVNRDMPFDDIKKIYQKKRREFHPDTLISKGLPDELLDKAKEKFIEIQQAFEVIEKKNSN